MGRTIDTTWRALARLDDLTGVGSVFGRGLDAVLLYHSVGGIDGIDYRWDVPTRIFSEHIRELDRQYGLVDLETLVTTDSPNKRVAISFDDGFRNVYEEALPILEEYDAPATLFVCPAFFDGNNLDLLAERHGLQSAPSDLVMTTRQVADVAASELFSIGNHTATHPDLATLSDPAEIEAEIVGTRERLEDSFGVAVDRFSYPYGRYDDDVAAVVEESHDLVVTSERSLVSPSTDRRRVPRFDATDDAHVVCFDVTDLAHRLRSVASRL